MSTESAVVPAIPMHGHEAWRRTRDIRERYLAAGDPERLPPPDCGVRREIVMSWRRSLLSGVDTAGTDLPRDSVVRSMSCDITIDDLPAGCPGGARGRQLTGLERAERQALLTALRAVAGDREAAARDLGISRATICRNLRLLGIREDGS